MTSPATYRCTACGREFSATSAYVRHGLSHLIDPAGRSPRVCFRGRMEPVGGDQLEPSRAGQVEGEGDAGGCGHKDNIATISVGGDVNRTADGGPTGSRDFTERNHA